MRRGIVVESTMKMLVVMTSDAQFVRLKPDGQAAVGSEIYFFQEDLLILHQAPSHRRSLAIASILILTLFVTAFFAPLEGRVYATVSLDVNPSALFYLDKDQEVMRYRALNKEAWSLLSLDLIGRPIDQVVDLWVDRANDLTPVAAPILIGFSSSDEDFYQSLRERLSSYAVAEDQWTFGLVGTRQEWAQESSIAAQWLENPEEEGVQQHEREVLSVVRGSIEEDLTPKELRERSGPSQDVPGFNKRERDQDEKNAFEPPGLRREEEKEEWLEKNHIPPGQMKKGGEDSGQQMGPKATPLAKQRGAGPPEGAGDKGPIDAPGQEDKLQPPSQEEQIKDDGIDTAEDQDQVDTEKEVETETESDGTGSETIEESKDTTTGEQEKEENKEQKGQGEKVSPDETESENEDSEDLKEGTDSEKDQEAAPPVTPKQKGRQ